MSSIQKYNNYSSNMRKNVNNKKSSSGFLNRNKDNELAPEDLEIVTMLEKLKDDLDMLYDNLNYITEPMLIDSYIYEINAVFMRYSYYLNLCKERKLVADEL